jgi:ComF family protein
MPHQVPRIRAVFYFEAAIREAVHRFKYDGVTALGQPLGYLMADYWLTHPTQSDMIVPVPLHPERRRKRGFNQAALLAKELSERVDLAMDATTLVRRRATASQVGLDVEQRKSNVRDAFHCTTDRLANRRVLLIDDVCTTGSTLEACALALWEGGVVSVEALTLARAH